MTEVDTTPRELPLWPDHAAAGARPMPVCGWTLPAHYGDPEAEYRAATESVAILDASFLTTVIGEGKDALDYLNRRLSQRVIQFQPGDGARASQLNAEGRMEADLEVFQLEPQRSLLLAPPAVSGAYLSSLCEKYVFSEDARFPDLTGEWALFALFGPKVPDVLTTFGGDSDIPAGKIVPLADGIQAFRSEFLPGAVALLVPADQGREALARLTSLATGLGGRRLGFMAFDTIRVESGTPWWGIDLTAKSIPLDADLFSAIHTNKGCYPGQETIAKILNLGHPARKMMGVHFEGDDAPPTGTPLMDGGREVGTLTSSTWSPRLNRPIGLAMMKWSHREPGTRVEISAGAVSGILASLPMVS